MNFEQALQYLLSLGHETLAMKLGLRNTELLLEKLGNPHKSYESVQIAGTNGKGSTAVMLDSICRTSGIRTGLYTSPHLTSITERIKIAGQEISQEEFAELATEVRGAAETLVKEGKIEARPTFFEHVTAIALLAFKNAGVQLAILETGLGGRLDATTVAGAATVAITPIALDHQEHLGETIAEIASEKAAIIRPGVNALISAQTAEALEVILRKGSETSVVPDFDNAGVNIEAATPDGRYTITLTTRQDQYEKVLLGLRGRHQIQNAALATRIAESLGKRGFDIPKPAVIEGLKKSVYSGRLELHLGPPRLLLDGAHNPSSARALRDYLDEFANGPITLVFGAMADKRLEEIAQILFPAAAELVVTAPQNLRAATPKRLQELAGTYFPTRSCYVVPFPGDALKKAQQVTPAGGLICVTGSLYLIGEMKTAIDANALAGVAT